MHFFIYLWYLFRFRCKSLYSNECNGEVYQQAIIIELSTHRVDAMNDTSLFVKESTSVGPIVLRVRPLCLPKSLTSSLYLSHWHMFTSNSHVSSYYERVRTCKRKSTVSKYLVTENRFSINCAIVVSKTKTKFSFRRTRNAYKKFGTDLLSE